MYTGAILIYQNSVGCIKSDVNLALETGWLTQYPMAFLFGKARTTLSYTFKAFFKKGVLNEKVVCLEFPPNNLVVHS